ncbi:heme NO-binding domain-containing protein [bacterium]|nr:heme NO-binding domain-containing protein [bacterium]
MLGMVNQAVEDMARSLGGESLWLKIAEGAGLDPEVGLLRMESYPDELTYALVGSASQVLSLSPDQVLEEFGKHWILYTGENGYGQLLKGAGQDLKTFIGNLDLLHGKVESLIPGTRCPRFSSQELGPNCLRLIYRSHRKGLGALVSGLLKGLGERFGTPVSVQILDPEEDCQAFEICWEQAP